MLLQHALLLSSPSPSVVAPTDWGKVITDVTAQFSVSTIVGVISSVVGI